VRVEQLAGLFYVRPTDWEQLRHEEGAAGQPVPYWARAWPSGNALATFITSSPPAPHTAVLEIGCGLGLPSLAAARAGASVLATDGSPEAIAFTAHAFALNHLLGDVAVVDWATQAEPLIARGPFDLVLAADILYLQANVQLALRLLPRLITPTATILLADPGRAGARDFLAAARASFQLHTTHRNDIAIHSLTPR
jgi:predicted nicotinamide N-methyase